MKRILVISWFFPPVNSSEGLVTYKLLNNSEFEYDVYCQKNNDSWSYGKEDELKIDSNVKCIYSDATILDKYVEKALEYYKANITKYDIVMTRSMPEESHIIGLKIKEINPSILWIASFGDPIGNNPFTLKSIKYNNPYSLSKRYERSMGLKEMISFKRIVKSYLYKKNYNKQYNLYVKTKNILEKNIVNNANYIICNSEYEKDYIIKNNNAFDKKDRFIVLPHSFDKSLYDKKTKRKESKIVFRYIGHLDDIRTPRLLFEAIKKLKENDEKLNEKAIFEFYGNLSINDKLYLVENDLYDIIKMKKPIKYLESLQKMQESDWLIHIDANIFDIIEKNIFFAAKLADYLGSKSKIMGITMLDGASADILRENNALVLTYSLNEIYNYLYLIIYKNYSIKMDDKARNNYSSDSVAKTFDKLIIDIKERKKCKK